MGFNTVSRRAFIKAVLAALVAAGCLPRVPETGLAPESTTAPLKPSNTPPPTIEPTTTLPPNLPSADGVVQAYLQAWQASDFEAMYNQLTAGAKGYIGYSAFTAAYRNVYNQATVLFLQPMFQSLLANGPKAAATFRVEWQTALFDAIETDHVMELVFEGDRWLVNWQPTLILPQLGHGVTLALLEETVERGTIFDAPDNPLAANAQAITVGVIPGRVEDADATIDTLSAIIGLDAAKIREKMAQAQPDWFVPLADIDFDTSVLHHETFSALAGVDRRPHPVRSYPQAQTASHVVGTLGGIRAEQIDSYLAQGYRGDEMIGLTGVEAWGEPFLAGKRGGQLVTYSPAGKQLAEVTSARPRPGGNIYLSLDTDLQQRAEALLGAQRGAIVVMEPTGFVKALASYPRFNPQDFATGIDAATWSALLNNPDRPLVNRATQGTFPPASTFKIASFAAALEKLDWSPDTTFTCTGKWAGLGDEFPKKCWLETGHGQITLKDGLTQSCDVVFYEVGMALHKADPTWLPEMARAFGFGTQTGILGIDDAAGVIPDEAWKQAALGEAYFVGDAVNSAIGQGYVLATPLQIARMLATVSTGGAIYRPQIVRRLSSRDSGDQFFTPEETGRLPISEFTLAIIREALLGVAHGRRGTARAAFEGVPYTVVGKTGTAETGIDAPHAWFAGYTPADDPAIVIAVLLENAGEGSEEAAPLFRLMAESYFDWAGIVWTDEG